MVSWWEGGGGGDLPSVPLRELLKTAVNELSPNVAVV